jgi:hypothetical protein
MPLRVTPEFPPIGPSTTVYEDPEFYRKLRQGFLPENPSVNGPVKEAF